MVAGARKHGIHGVDILHAWAPPHQLRMCLLNV